MMKRHISKASKVMMNMLKIMSMLVMMLRKTLDSFIMSCLESLKGKKISRREELMTTTAFLIKILLILISLFTKYSLCSMRIRFV